MAEIAAAPTPMMRQYLELKERYPDTILFFRLGDFYEMFFEDAVTASRVLQITLTARSKGDDKVPMCGSRTTPPAATWPGCWRQA